MVERLKKIETNTFRVQRRESGKEEHEGKRQQGQTSDEQEKHDEFAPKLDFTKWTGDEAAAAQHQPSLWERRPAAGSPEPEPPKPPQAAIEGDEEKTLEEQTLSTSITFLRAAGLIKREGGPRWSTISLYALAFVGFLISVIFVLNALL